jgi:CRISPR/Cas system-associated endoribonuclease Cas2
VRVAQLLLNHGERVQESVYELRLRVGEWPALVRQLRHERHNGSPLRMVRKKLAAD